MSGLLRSVTCTHAVFESGEEPREFNASSTIKVGNVPLGLRRASTFQNTLSFLSGPHPSHLKIYNKIAVQHLIRAGLAPYCLKSTHCHHPQEVPFVAQNLNRNCIAFYLVVMERQPPSAVEELTDMITLV